jgi:GNAT superfamily N-acetyltransferase
MVVAYADGDPVGSGGVSMAEGVARLWGGAVRPEARRQGVYRAILGARLRYGAAHAATLALVKGRIETSAPILRQAGFAAYGQEIMYRVPLAQALSARHRPATHRSATALTPIRDVVGVGDR